ncbi:MAG: hypothetical protein U0441_16790 [Polyangiaceae bacterium]
MKSLSLVLTSLVVAVSLAACNSSGGGEGGTGSNGLPSCPSGGTDLTYANFGQAFFTNYCNGCHSSTASSRQGAPSAINFDTQAEIQARVDEIYAESGDSNNSMPPSSYATQPSSDDRSNLTEWLSCGAP